MAGRGKLTWQLSADVANAGKRLSRRQPGERITCGSLQNMAAKCASACQPAGKGEEGTQEDEERVCGVRCAAQTLRSALLMRTRAFRGHFRALSREIAGRFARRSEMHGSVAVDGGQRKRECEAEKGGAGHAAHWTRCETTRAFQRAFPRGFWVECGLDRLCFLRVNWSCCVWCAHKEAKAEGCETGKGDGGHAAH